jgi:hypothetical protein
MVTAATPPSDSIRFLGDEVADFRVCFGSSKLRAVRLSRTKVVSCGIVGPTKEISPRLVPRDLRSSVGDCHSFFQYTRVYLTAS